MMAQAKNSHIWERDEHDWYVEPTAATEALLSVEQFSGPVLDPCCGGGNIVKTLRAAGYDAFGSDIVDRANSPEWFLGQRDYLAGATVDDRDCLDVVMNPPFFRAKGAETFIRAALDRASCKVCAFVDIRFIAGAQRANGLFADHPPQRVWIITPRVSCPPGTFLQAGGKAGNGSSDWCWLVWDKTSAATPTTLGWLRRAT